MTALLGKGQTVDEVFQGTTTELITTAERKRNDAIIHEYTDKLAWSACARHLLEISSGGEGYCVCGTVTVSLRDALDGGIRKRRSGVVQAHCEEHARHIVVVAEVSVQHLSATNRERSSVVVKRMVDGSVIDNGCVVQARDQLICKTNTLSWSKRVATAVAVVLAN